MTKTKERQVTFTSGPVTGPATLTTYGCGRECSRSTTFHHISKTEDTVTIFSKCPNDHLVTAFFVCSTGDQKRQLAMLDCDEVEEEAYMAALEREDAESENVPEESDTLILDGQHRLHRIPTTADDDMWVCRCDCGNKTTVSRADLESGKVTSCGCLSTINPTEEGRVR